MNNLTKKLPLLVSVASAISFCALMVYQSGIIGDLQTELNLTIRKLSITEESLASERLLNAQLQEEITVLRDSLGILENVVEGLNHKVEGLKKTIEGLNAVVQQKENKVTALTAEISRLNKNSETNALKINELESRRDQLLTEMKRIDDDRQVLRQERDTAAKEQSAQSRQKEKVKLEIEHKVEEVKPEPESMSAADSPLPKINRAPEKETDEAPALDAEKQQLIKNSEQKRLHRILSETKVHFSKIALRSKEDGKDLKRLKENGWRFTLIELNLEHVEQDLIANEKFLVQLYDLDNQKVVPMNEKNLNYPNSSQGAAGRTFTYEEKPLSLPYVNTQKKEGNNYEIRLYYLKGNLVMPLQNGTLTIVRNGEIVRK